MRWQTRTAPPPPARAQDSSTGVLVRQMAEQVSRLVRDELVLAEIKMTRKGARAGRGNRDVRRQRHHRALRSRLPDRRRCRRYRHGAVHLACGFDRRRAARQEPAEEGHAASAGRDGAQRQGRCRGDQREGPPMTAEESGDAAAASALPDNQQAVLEDIARTREQLGETVEALTARADVNARAREKVAELSGRFKDKPQNVKDLVAVRADQARSGLADKTADTPQTTGAAGAPVASQEKDGAAAVFSAAPEPVQQTAKRAAGTVADNPVPFAVAAGSALVAGWLVYRWQRR